MAQHHRHDAGSPASSAGRSTTRCRRRCTTPSTRSSASTGSTSRCRCADEIGLRRVVAAIRVAAVRRASTSRCRTRPPCSSCATRSRRPRSMAGAVNTVHCVDGRLIGYNTDGRGLLESLRDDAGFSTRRASASCSSAPAERPARRSSRSSSASAASVDVVNRDVDRAEELVARVEPHAARRPRLVAHRRSTDAERGRARRRSRRQRDAGRDARRTIRARFPPSGCMPGRSCSTWSTAARGPTLLVREARGRPARPRSTVSACSWPGRDRRRHLERRTREVRTPREIMRRAAEARARRSRRQEAAR